MLLRYFVALACVIFTCIAATPAPDLAGLWAARHITNTAAVRGPLMIRRLASGWRAEIGGRYVAVTNVNGTLSFDLPGAEGSFLGKLASHDKSIIGHWMQARTDESGSRYASPVTLTSVAPNVWLGRVTPLDDPMTFYLRVQASTAGSDTSPAFVFNFERDLGNQFDIDRLQRDGNTVRLLAKLSGRRKGAAQIEGVYRPDEDVMSFDVDGFGGTYDFKRVPPDAASDFYPRGRPSVPYAYVPPPKLDDGWKVGVPEDVGMSRAGLEKLVQAIVDMPMDSSKARQLHAILIARHGKLVLEEYFHGMNRDLPHDPRSASKGITAVLFGASMFAGVPVSPSTPVYSAMNGGTFPANLDSLKRSMTVDSLLTMSSGLDCDDNDDASPGNENSMWDRTDIPDWYAFTLDLKMIRRPGEQAVYCSIQPNLVGGILSRVSGRSIPDLFHDFLAVPMNIKRYYVPLQPNGQSFMGGGLRLLPRDFLKFPQLFMDGGVWNGHRILSAAYAARATSHLADVKYFSAPQYGYLWWISYLPYKGGTVRAFSMLGSGDNTYTAIPQLDLVVEFEQGQYRHGPFDLFKTFLPTYVFPAITR